METTRITGHNERVIAATRQVLLEVFHLLEKFHDSLVLVGGWVPIMIIPDAVDKHVGTIDVDLAINDKTLVENGSETMQSILVTNGYQHGGEPGRFIRKIYIEGQPINVPVDFLSSEYRYIPENEFYDITGTRDRALHHVAAGDSADFRNLENLPYLRPSGKHFLCNGFQEPFEGSLQVRYGFVDNAVKPYFCES